MAFPPVDPRTPCAYWARILTAPLQRELGPASGWGHSGATGDLPGPFLPCFPAVPRVHCTYRKRARDGPSREKPPTERAARRRIACLGGKSRTGRTAGRCAHGSTREEIREEIMSKIALVRT